MCVRLMIRFPEVNLKEIGQSCSFIIIKILLYLCSGSDAASIQTKATLSEDGKHFLLNGSKVCDFYKII